MRLFLGGLRKLPPRPATYVSLGLVLALIVLVFAGATAARAIGRQAGDDFGLVTFPDAYRYVSTFIVEFCGLFALVYGAAIAGSEWAWGTLKSAVARGEGRAHYVVLSYASIVVLLGLGLLVTFGVGVVAALLGATAAHVPASGVSDATALGRLPADLAKLWLAMAAEGALGYAIATLARSPLAGIGVGIAVYFGSQFGAILVPDLVQYLPFSAANALLGPDLVVGGGNVPTSTQLDPTAAFAVVVAWLVGSLLLAAVATERAEVGG